MNERPMYEALFEMYSTQRNNRHSHARRLANTARRFSAQTAKILGYPHSHFELSDGSYLPWVRLYELHEDGDAPKPLTGSRTLPESFLSDGTLRFGLGVAISAELNSFPKEYFWAGYKLSAPSITGPMTLTEEWGEKESFILSEDSGDFDSAIANFIATLKSALTDEEPAASDKRRPIGSIGFLAEIQ